MYLQRQVYWETDYVVRRRFNRSTTLPGLTRLRWESEQHTEFLAMAVQAGLVSYVKHTIRSLRRTPKWLPLEYALQLDWGKMRFNGAWQLSPSMISCHLRYGERPNKASQHGIMWIEFVVSIAKCTELHTDDLFVTFEILVIDGGASIFASILRLKC